MQCRGHSRRTRAHPGDEIAAGLAVVDDVQGAQDLAVVAGDRVGSSLAGVVQSVAASYVGGAGASTAWLEEGLVDQAALRKVWAHIGAGRGVVQQEGHLGAEVALRVFVGLSGAARDDVSVGR